MKNTDITKIRQLANDIVNEISCKDYAEPSSAEERCLSRANQILALFPCETCNDTKKAPTPQSIGFGKQNEILDACPNCQPQSCSYCGGINGKHKQVDDPQAGDSNMLTKMQCPLDKIT